MKRTKKLLSGITGGIVGLTLVAAPAYADSSKTIVGNATTPPLADTFTTLVTAVSTAGLVDTLNGTDDYTVFAPTNDAFAKLPSELVTALLLQQNADLLTDILLYHVVPGTVLSTDLTDGMTVIMANGEDLTVTIGSDVMINDATVVVPDVPASNGVIHAIDTVLLPPLPTIVGVATGDTYGDTFSTLVSAVIDAGLVPTLDGTTPYTVFAPTNDAFDDIADTVATLTIPELTDILLYHVVPGTVYSSQLSDGMTVTAANGDTLTISLDSGVMVNDSEVIVPDVVAANGVIHAIDTVLLPPTEEEPTDTLPTIVDIAVQNDFTALVEAVTSQGLGDTLTNGGPFTVFAPTNEAFEKLPPYVSRALERNPALLTDILLYHVVDGKIESTDIKRFQKVSSKEGSPLYARSLNKGVKINKADVVLADIEASNGIVHVVDEVLIPRSLIKDELKRVQSELREILKALRSR